MLKQTLLFFSILDLVFPPSIASIHSLLCPLLWAAECYLTKRGQMKGGSLPDPEPAIMELYSLNPLSWSEARLHWQLRPLISLTGLSLDPTGRCLMEPVSAPRDKFNQAPR